LETGRQQQRLVGLQGKVYQGRSLVFSPNSRLILSGGPDETVCLWDAATGRLLHTLQGHFQPVCSVAFSADGRRAVSADAKGNIRLWNVQTGEPVRTLHTLQTGEILALSSDGRRALLASRDTLHLWDLEQNRELQSWETEHAGGIMSVALSADGRRAASSGWDRGVRVWDTDTGRELLRTMEGGKGLTTCLALSLDGQSVLAGDVKGSVRLWHVATGQELKHFQGHTLQVTGVAISADGRKAVSSSRDTTVSVWKVSP
jgi:WD40 repeat protein